MTSTQVIACLLWVNDRRNAGCYEHCPAATIGRLLLLTWDKERNSKDNYSRTLLSWAAKKGYKAIVKLLLLRDGVDPDSKDIYGPDPKDRDGRSPLWWAKEAVGKSTEFYQHPHSSLHCGPSAAQTQKRGKYGENNLPH
jgi:Ankyrin repeat